MTMKPGRHGGFSLLELILVLVIIGIVLSAVTLSITNRRLDNLQLEAKRLQALIAMATDQAVMTNQEFGLSIDESGYQFMSYDHDSSNWLAVDQNVMKQFQHRSLPEGVLVLVQVAGLYGSQSSDDLLAPVKKETDEDQEESTLQLPQILMLSSAEVTPFVIRLGYNDEEPAYFELKTEVNGSLSLSHPVYEPMNIGWSDVWQD